MTTAPDLNELFATVSKKVGITLTFTGYLKETIWPVKEDILACLEEFLGRWQSELTWYVDTDLRRFRNATPDLLRQPLEHFADEENVERDFHWLMFRAGAHQEAPSLALLAATKTGAHPSDSYLSISLPVQTFEQDFLEFRDLVLRWARRVPFLSGQGGFAFSESPVRSVQQSYAPYVVATAHRFLGVEINDPLTTALGLKRSYIKSTNWLTVVSDELLANVGGVESLRPKFGSAIEIHSVKGGALFQAGPAPRVGDVNAGDNLPEYREVARALKTLRAPEHYRLEGMDWPKTMAWLARLD